MVHGSEEVTVGADPELFLQSTITGQFVSAHDLLPGTKPNPFRVKDGAIQVDGTAAEFNIVPTSDPKVFVSRIATVIGELSGMVAGYDLKPVAIPTVHYEPRYFEALPDSAKILGCEPDYDAWKDGEINPSPADEGERVTFRTGGGHIHVGWTEGKSVTDVGHFYDCVNFARQMDLALYIPSLFWDRDRERQRLYGKPGTFRVKSYGMEYRPLSNRWVMDPHLAEFVFLSAREAWKTMFNEEHDLNTHKELTETFLNPKRTAAQCLKYIDDLFGWGMPTDMIPVDYLEME